MQFIPRSDTERTFIYSLVVSKPFQIGIQQRVTGSTGSRQRAKPKDVAIMKVVDPGEALRVAFSHNAFPMVEMANRNFIQSQTLAQLRDTLLPKLLSGELPVTEAYLTAI